MKVGLAVGHFAPSVGGSEEVVRQIATGLRDRGHDVRVATTARADRRQADMPVPVDEFDCRGNLVNGIVGDAAGYERYLLETDRDAWLFYAAQIWSTDLALQVLSRIPARTVVAPCGYSGLHDPVYSAYFERLPELLSQADGLVYHSRHYQDFTHDQAAGLGSLAHVIPNGAPAIADSPGGGTERARRGSGLRVITISNHRFLKGHGRSIAAFKQAAGRGDRYEIVGEPTHRNPRSSCWLSCTLAGVRDRRIRVRRATAQADTASLLRASDIFLFGSHVEAAPLVIIEAMSAGLPFVSTPVGNVAEYEACGLVVPPEDLPGALGSLLTDAGLRQQLGREGLARWRRNHQWPAIIDQYERLLLGQAGSSSS